MRPVLCILVSFLVVSFGVAAQVESTISPQQAKIGDKLLVDVQVTGVSSQAVQFPLPNIEDFTLLGIDSSALQTRNLLRYSFAVYDTGHYVLPEMPVVVRAGAAPETLYTRRLGVTILSVLPDTASTLLPLKPYREHPFRWRDVWRAVKSSPWTWVGLSLLVVGLAAWIWRRKFRRGPVAEITPKIILPAHEKATRELISLRDKRYPQRGMFKEFFVEYSQIMRGYLEHRYQFPALEMTTFDLERELSSDEFPDTLGRRLLPTLHEADLVKFAKYVPRPETCEEALQTGFELVDLTKLVETVAEEAKAA